jgi:hypothetical protein
MHRVPLRKPHTSWDALQNLRDQFSLSVRNVDWIHLVHDRGQWWAFGNNVMNCWVPYVGKGRIVSLDILKFSNKYSCSIKRRIISWTFLRYYQILKKFSNKYSCSTKRRIISWISLRYYQILKTFSNKYSCSIERPITSWISLRYYQIIKTFPTNIHVPLKGR